MSEIYVALKWAFCEKDDKEVTLQTNVFWDILYFPGILNFSWIFS